MRHIYHVNQAFTHTEKGFSYTFWAGEVITIEFSTLGSVIATVHLPTGDLTMTLSNNELVDNCSLLQNPIPGPAMATQSPTKLWGDTPDPYANVLFYVPEMSLKCECGAHAVGVDKHSPWCQLWSK